jgi:UMF1 family MFS transporter
VIIVAIFITAVYANSRTMMARIAPARKMAEFFGLYALSGTATAFLAPFVVARFTEWFQSNAIGLASILILLIAGWVMMLFVKTERAPDVG